MFFLLDSGKKTNQKNIWRWLSEGMADAVKITYRKK